MSYEERYGERYLTDEEERLEEERVKKEERLEMLERCVERIKELTEEAASLEDLVSEINYEIRLLG